MKFDRKPAPSADELRRLYVDEGLSMAAIGKRWGLSGPSVLARLRDAGIPTRAKRSAVTREALVAAIERGESQADIARAYGLTHGAVHAQLRRHGLRAPEGRGHGRGPDHPSWRGGRIRQSGYVMVWAPDHPYADKRGRIMEHRLVMEEQLGRYLRPEEVVHHMNHVTDDNRPENLMLMPDHRTHMQHHRPKGAPVALGGGRKRR